MKISCKIKVLFTCVFLTMTLASCASKSASEKDKTEGPATKTEAEKSFTVSATGDALPGEAANVKAASAPKNGTEFAGVTGVSSSIVVHNFETLIMRSRGSSGSFFVAAMNENGTEYPVLSTVDEYTNSSFYLTVGKNVYKLSGNPSVKSASIATDTGMKVLYEIPKIAQVVLDFSAFSTVTKGDYDMVKVTATAKNLGLKSREMGLKVVLDTVLGEKTKIHFTDAEGMPIQTELLARDITNYRMIQSRNDKAVLQTVFEGSEATTPEYILVGNRDVLDTTSWEPNMLRARSFNTVLSYNNTAIGVNWPKEIVIPSEELKVVFYMGVSVLPSTLDALAYAEGRQTTKKNSAKAAEEAPKTPEKRPVKVITEDPDGDAEAEMAKAHSEQDEPQFTVDKVTDEQMSPEYIQSLLDRIANLEESDSTINRDALLMLNSELDVILQKLRM